MLNPKRHITINPNQTTRPRQLLPQIAKGKSQWNHNEGISQSIHRLISQWNRQPKRHITMKSPHNPSISSYSPANWQGERQGTITGMWERELQAEELGKTTRWRGGETRKWPEMATAADLARLCRCGGVDVRRGGSRETLARRRGVDVRRGGGGETPAGTRGVRTAGQPAK